MKLHGLHDREEALRILRLLFTALDEDDWVTDCSECCEHGTPLISETEAEYIREEIAKVPYERYLEILNATKKWFLKEEGVRTQSDFKEASLRPDVKRREVEKLRQNTCPYLRGDASCMLEGFQPLACRLPDDPRLIPANFIETIQKIFTIYPQMTGFLPSQVFAVLDQQGFFSYVANTAVDDAKLARGTYLPLVQFGGK